MDDMSDIAISVDTSGDFGLRILSFLFLMVIAYVFQRLAKTRLRINKSQYFLVAISINLILALTIAWWRVRPSGTAILTRNNSWAYILDTDPNWLFNLLLYIPAAFFLSKALGKTVAPLLFLFLISLIIEFLQGKFYWGISNPADLVANTGGALIGVLIAKLMQRRNSGA